MRNLLRNKNFYLIFCIDAAFILLSLYLAYVIRFEFRIPEKELENLERILPFAVAIKLGIFFFFRMYQGMWRYTGLADLFNVVKAVFVSTTSIIVFVLVMHHFIGYPRSVFIIDSVLTLLFIGGLRVGIRVYFMKDSVAHIFPGLIRIRGWEKQLFIIRAGSLATDMVLAGAAFYLAYAIRFEWQIPRREAYALFAMLPIILSVKMGVFIFFHLYQSMWRFTSLMELINVVKAVTTSTLGIIVVILVLNRFEGYPRSVFFIDWGLTLLLIGGVRIGIRVYFSKNGHNKNVSGLPEENSPKRLLLIGAGDAGEKVLREILDNPRLNFAPVGFLDDYSRKLGRTIHGIEVLGAVEQITSFVPLFDEILITVPSATRDQMRRIVAACEQTGKKFRTIPSIGELIDGKVSVSAIRDVTLEDLLGREEVQLNRTEISGYLQGKRVLITGAGGSIGSELVRQVGKFHPESLALVDMCEFNLFRLELECRQRFADGHVVSFLVDIRDPGSINRVFQEFAPQVVFHAAAYKHVPMQELHPWETVRNNVLGTRNLLQAVRRHVVEKFVLVSTDKAVRPTNVMGATKRIAEKLTLCSLNRTSMTQGMVVRFGNVVGSSGSVIPIFQEQIARGGPVTVTHPEVTRYFMSIPEAAQLILEAGAMGKGGETFILDMGKPVRIAELARDLIRLQGYEPDRDIPIIYIGLRPGEKLYEELITEGEGIVETDHKKILVLRGNGYDLNGLQGHIDELIAIACTYDQKRIKQKLQEIVPEYTPEFQGL